MKTITCYEAGCEQQFSHDDRDTLLHAMHAHYTEVHPTVIPNASDADKKAWMEQFTKDWEAA